MENSVNYEQETVDTETQNDTADQTDTGKNEGNNTDSPVDFGALLKDKGFQAELGPR